MFAITGFSGFIGQNLVSYLKSKKIKFIKIGREKTKSDFLIDDLSKNTEWIKALKGIKVVFHLAGRAHILKKSSKNSYEKFEKNNHHATKKLIEDASKAGVKRIIFLSTIKVNGEKTLKGIPFNQNSKNNPQDSYALSKLKAEDELIKASKKNNIEITIIRIPLVYGPGVKANFLKTKSINFLKLIDLVYKKIPLPFGSINNLRSLIYIENLVDFLYVCAENENAKNQIFILSDPYPISTTKLIKIVANVMKIKPIFLPIPKIILRIIFFFLGKSDIINKLILSLEIDPKFAYQTLNWNPPFSTLEGLKKTTKWFLEKKRLQKLK